MTNSPQKIFENFYKAFPVNAFATSVPYIQHIVQQYLNFNRCFNREASYFYSISE